MPALRRCVRSAMGEVTLELKVAPGVANFTAIDIIGADADAEGCIHGVLDEIRFSPSTIGTPIFRGIQP
jgi:hypothetical protein